MVDDIQRRGNTNMVHQANPIFSEMKETRKTDSFSRSCQKAWGSVAILIGALLVAIFKGQ